MQSRQQQKSDCANYTDDLIGLKMHLPNFAFLELVLELANIYSLTR